LRLLFDNRPSNRYFSFLTLGRAVSTVTVVVVCDRVGRFGREAVGGADGAESLEVSDEPYDREKRSSIEIGVPSWRGVKVGAGDRIVGDEGCLVSMTSEWSAIMGDAGLVGNACF